VTLSGVNSDLFFTHIGFDYGAGPAINGGSYTLYNRGREEPNSERGRSILCSRTEAAAFRGGAETIDQRSLPVSQALRTQTPLLMK
jgi:hypothetical protein